MPLTQVTIQSGEQTSTGKGYKFKTSHGLMFSFDPKTSKELLGSIGEYVNVDAITDPPKEGSGYDKGLTRIVGFHGVADPSSAATATPAAAPSTASAPAARGGGASHSPTKRNGGFTGDPINHVLISRQVALKAAIELAGPGGAEVSSILECAQELNEWILAGLSPYLLVDGIQVSHVLPWNKAAREKANKSAAAQAQEIVKAVKADPPPPPPEAEDDGIPF